MMSIYKYENRSMKMKRPKIYKTVQAFYLFKKK